MVQLCTEDVLKLALKALKATGEGENEDGSLYLYHAPELISDAIDAIEIDLVNPYVADNLTLKELHDFENEIASLKAEIVRLQSGV